MAEINLDIVALFKAQFGTEAESFQFEPVTGDDGSDAASTGNQGSPYWATDINGRAVYMPVTITYPDPTQLSTQDASLLGSSTLGLTVKWTLPYCVITPSCKKQIVKTPLTERGGTVKELINVDDWEFNIEGFLISQDGVNEFPEADYTTLCRLYECNVAVQIGSVVTDIVLKRPSRNGSVYVVIESLEFPANRGVKHVKPYRMRLCSDQVFNLVDIS